MTDKTTKVAPVMEANALEDHAPDDDTLAAATMTEEEVREYAAALEAENAALLARVDVAEQAAREATERLAAATPDQAAVAAAAAAPVRPTFVSAGVAHDVEVYGKAVDPATGKIITKDDVAALMRHR